MTNFTPEIQKYDKNTSHIRQQKQYLDLLLLADEQESMIDRYLERGEMFILSDNDTVKASCVITCEDKGIYEIKSIAVYPEYQRQGYGRQLIAFVLEHYKDRCHTMLVGTGDSPLTIPFYESCGLHTHTGYPISLSIITTTPYLKEASN